MEREHKRRHGDSGREDRGDEARAPGRTTEVERLQRRTDGNGVHEGADEAVARAGGTSGATLPEAVQRKFESSLGADLSGVRVHTGGESAEAAQSVGARAYTVGQDIHFAAGQYDPQSSKGQHLLAHEVAHTVQQSGGASRAQFKLEVSSPGDAHEHEADRAADAMVHGAPAAVSPAGAILSRNEDPPPGAGWTKRGDEWVRPRAEQEKEERQYEEEQLRRVAPYAAPPKNWEAAAAERDPGEAVPGVWQYSANQPEKPDALNEDDWQGWQRSQQYTRDVLATQGAWESLRGRVQSYADANSEISKSGADLQALGWDAAGSTSGTPPAANLSEVALAQQLGGGNSLGDLFKDKQGAMGTEAQGVEAQPGGREVKTAHLKVKVAARELSDASSSVNNAWLGLSGATDSLTAASLAVEIKQKETDRDKAQKQLDELKRKKESWGGDIDGIKAVLAVGAKLVEAVAERDPFAGFEAFVEAAAGIGKSVASSAYDGEIAQVQSRIDGLSSQIAAESQHYVTAQLSGALKTWSSKLNELQLKRRDAQSKLVNYEIAYDEFAATAGKSAGGGAKGARLQAALEAIPRVGVVLSRISGIIEACNVPSYSEGSGLGWGAVGAPADFPVHIGLIKGYRTRYSEQAKIWQARLESLEKIRMQTAGG